MSEVELDLTRLKGLGLKIVIGVIAITVLYFTISPAAQFIEAGHRGVLLHWGAVDTTIPPLDAGLHWVTPYQDQVVQVDTRVKAFQATASSASKDLQVVTTQITINYHLSPERVNLFYKNVGLDFENKIIAPAIQEVTKQVTAKYEAINLIQQRALVKDEIEKSLAARLLTFDIITDVVSITEFNFSDQFTKAIEDKVTAEQTALAEQNRIIVQQAIAQQSVATAEGQRQSTVKIAEGQANATLIQAVAQAQAIKLIQEQLAQNPSYIEYLKWTKWNGQLPTTMFGNSGINPLITIPTGK